MGDGQCNLFYFLELVDLVAIPLLVRDSLLESVVKTKTIMAQSRQRACVTFESAGADPPDLDQPLVPYKAGDLLGQPGSSSSCDPTTGIGT